MNLIEKAYSKYIVYNIPFTAKTLWEYYRNSRKYQLMDKLFIGFSDHAPEHSLSDAEIKRICEAYKLMKNQQANVPEVYQIKGGWELQLKNFMGELTDAIREDDCSRVQAILSNVYRNSASAWLNGASCWKNYRDKPLYKFAYINMWLKHWNHYRHMRGQTPFIEFHHIGNPVGIYHNNFLIPDEAIRFKYSTDDMLSLLDDVDHPVICEIGAGLGEQAFSLISESIKPVTYIICDIPEMVTVITYILMCCFPHKKILLYGENCAFHYADYDIVLWPNYNLTALKDSSVDLFYNSCSFPEMDSATVDEYLKEIGRACRKYFMHINISADVYWDDLGRAHNGLIENTKHNRPGSKIKLDKDDFKLIYQHPWLFSTPGADVLYKDAGYVAYLYEKRKVF